MGTYEELLERLTALAEAEEEIRAAVVIGSQARQDSPADRYSDLDVILAVREPEKFLASEEWMLPLGTPRISFVEHTMAGQKERRVLFDGMLDVDFILVSEGNARMLDKVPDMRALFRRGYRVLSDKMEFGAVISRLLSGPDEPARMPPEETYRNITQDFWFHTVWMAKKLRRGELWVAKNSVDGYLKRLLLQMLEWHAKAVHGPEYDTWHNGRFLERWAGEVAGRVPETFAAYTPEDMAGALRRTMDLFRELAADTAERLGYAYPQEADRSASEWVEELLREGKI